MEKSVRHLLIFVVLTRYLCTARANTSFSNENDGQANGLIREEWARGPPGKKGPVGPAGPPGPKGSRGISGSPGAPCDCSALEARVARIERGWYKASNGLYYRYFGHEKVDHATAIARCGAHGARLAAAGLRTAALRNEIRTLFPSPFPTTWIGLDDLHTRGTYMWADGIISTRGNTDWGRSEPNRSDERCTAMAISHNGAIADIYCSRVEYYLCELV